MTLEELRKQLHVNNKRSVIRAIFYLIITIAAIFINPIIALAPVLCLAVTQYWIMQNSSKIKEEIEKREKS